jgi:hypothetical protein
MKMFEKFLRARELKVGVKPFSRFPSPPAAIRHIKHNFLMELNHLTANI